MYGLAFAIVGSLLLHALGLLALALAVVWGAGIESEKSKPPQMDVVEIEGGGGGLGGIGEGPGMLATGKAGRKEAVTNSGAPSSKLDIKDEDIKFKDLPKLDAVMPVFDNSPESKDGDILAYLERERVLAEKILATQPFDPAIKPGGAGVPGGTGGPKGPGLGNKKGPGKGTGATGPVLTEQRRRELRWILFVASEDGDDHLKKLQALKVTVFIPLRRKPGYVMRYDLSKPTVHGEEIRFVDDANKVRWFTRHVDFNGNPEPRGKKQAEALARVLGAPELPDQVIISLPSDLEKDMARRELLFEGRHESEIASTLWGVRKQVDGNYENEPYIMKQILRPGVK